MFGSEKTGNKMVKSCYEFEIQSTLSKVDTLRDQLQVSALERCPPYREVMQLDTTVHLWRQNWNEVTIACVAQQNCNVQISKSVWRKCLFHHSHVLYVLYTVLSREILCNVWLSLLGKVWSLVGAGKFLSSQRPDFRLSVTKRQSAVSHLQFWWLQLLTEF